MVKKVKTFLSDFQQSLLPQPKYYKKFARKDFWFSFKYFFIVIFLLNITLFCLFFGGWLEKPYNTLSLARVESALRDYPSDLTINIVDGALSTNYQHPYFLWSQDGDKQFLLAVVSETSTAQEITQYEAPLMFTGNELVLAKQESGRMRNAFDYGNLNLTVDKAAVNNVISVLEKIRPLLIVIILLFVLVIAPLAAVAGTFVYLALVSLFCYFIFGLYSKKHTYLKTLKISMHAMTLPFVTKYALLGFGYNLDRAWPVFGLLVVIFLLAALYETYIDR